MNHFRKAPHLACRIIEQKAYIVDAQQSMLHELDGVGTCIWQALDKERTIEELTARISAAYDVSPEQAAADLTEFLHELERKNLIVSA